MANSVESQYKDLLNPVKDPEKSFSINISELLQSFVSDLVEGRTTPNFNSAALLLQGSASIYGKKVEYLHNLATQLHNNLLKQKKDDQQQTKRETKEREKKEEKTSDPFLSVEIKFGKNLSCLRKKNTSKATSKKPAKKCKSACIPVNLLSADNEEKGEVFYDTRGEIVGNKGDFAINKCRLINSGWLLLPTVNPKLVPSFEAVPDYYDDSRLLEDNNCDFDNLQSSPDEGLGSSPRSDISVGATPDCAMDTEDTAKPSEVGDTSLLIDEGIGNTPNEDNCPSPGTDGIENVPTDDGGDDESNPAPMPVRQTVRHALKACQLALEDDPLAGVPIDKDLLQRKKIQKRNTRCLPSKLKMSAAERAIVSSISDYCARTFFAMDGKALKNSLLAFDVDSFDQNSKFVKRILDKLSALKSDDRRNKSLDPIEDEKEVDVDGLEVLKDANEDDDNLCIPFDDSDIQIDNDPGMRFREQPPLPSSPPPPPPPPAANDEPTSEVDAVADLPSPDISHIAHEQCENYIREVHQFVQNSDITERVHEWEKSVKPFLDELEERESFDINLYGSRILNAFKDSNQKQTMTFRQFCKNKEKWEIHRYFMALLPLANVGNVSIESELNDDGTEEIFVTLLSRKMHHKELEAFGHGEGSHS